MASFFAFMAKKPQAEIDKPVAESQLSLPRSAKNEYGVSGEMTISTFDSEEQRVDELSLRDYRRMRDNDGQVQMLLSAVYNTILAAGFEIVDDPDYLDENKDSETQEDSEEKLFVEQNLQNPRWKDGMSTDIEHINRINLRAFEEGYRLFEVVYRLDPDGKFRLDKLAPRGARSSDTELKIITDDKGNFHGFHQRTYFNSKTIDVRVVNDTDIAKVINVVYGSEYGSNYGRSALKPIHYHYDKLHKALYLNHVGHELGAIKFRHVKKKGGGSQTSDDKLFNTLTRVGSESVVMYPEAQYELIFEDVSDAAVMAIGKDMIMYHTAQMAKAIMAQFIDLGSQVASTGARSLGEDQIAFFKNGLQAIAHRLIEVPWNRLIADLVKINFNHGIYPSLKVNPLQDESVTILYETFKEFAKSGGITDKLKAELLSKASEKLKLDINTEEILTDLEAEKKLEQDHKDQEMQLQQQRFAQPAKSTNLADYMEDGPLVSTAVESDNIRPLFLDEQKLKLVDIKRKLDDARVRAEYVLRDKLSIQREAIVTDYLAAIRRGKKSIKKVTISLAEQDQNHKYSEELLLLAFELSEYGKILAANELGRPVPTTKAAERALIEDMVEIMTEEQETRLQLRLRSIANNALQTGMPENETRIRLEQEFTSFFDSVVAPTLSLLIPESFNRGRSISFKQYSDDIFAYRYTAVLDSRTTAYCRKMDGSVFQSNDPNFALVTPPNHFGCRSFWTPITKVESTLQSLVVTGKPLDLPSYSSVSSFRDVGLSEASLENEIQNLIDTI